MSVYQYIRKFIQQFKSSEAVKFSAAVLLVSVVLGAASAGLISQNVHAIPFLSAPAPTHTLTAGRSVSRSKIAFSPDAKVIPTPVPTVAPTPVPATVAVPTATPAPVSGGPGGDVVSIIDQVFGSYAGAAVSVAQCESGLNPAAVGPSGAVGLFQILPSTFNTTPEAGNSPYDAYANTSAAYYIFVRDGYSWR
ncbi:MAG TPA: transglycosylase SLT domain-containing protein, partial [Ktedonobacteraceae bacterium]